MPGARSKDLGGRAPGVRDPSPWWGPIAVSGALVGLVVYLVAAQRYEGLAGGLATAVANYWLPVRPNRAPGMIEGGTPSG